MKLVRDLRAVRRNTPTESECSASATCRKNQRARRISRKPLGVVGIPFGLPRLPLTPSVQSGLEVSVGSHHTPIYNLPRIETRFQQVLDVGIIYNQPRAGQDPVYATQLLLEFVEYLGMLLERLCMLLE